MSRTLRPKTLLLWMVTAILLSSALYGFAASNVVPESGAGDGTGTVSGYTVSNISYTLDSTNPSTLSSVSIDVAPTSGAGDPSVVRITVDGGTNWISCTGPTGSTWACTFATKPSVSTITNLQVVAAE